MKRLFVITIAMHFAVLANAQFGINVGVNALRFMGDVGKKNNSNYFGDACLGYNLGVDYRVGDYLGFNLNGLYGKLQGTDNDITSYRNFQSTVMGGELNVFCFFDKKNGVAKEAGPFISAGFGYLMFNPQGDLKNGNDTYHYWNDGSIRNMQQSAANDPIATMVKRDYVYETKLTDSTTSYSRGTMYVPLTLGTSFNMGFRSSLRLAVTYNLAFSDYMDNYKTGGNDSWLGANLTLNINFSKPPASEYDDADFSAVDLALIDSDNDGVKDLSDECEGTPKGAKVNHHGCPHDDDKDGIPDYRDKEPHSKHDANVDPDGVTINEIDYAVHQMEWDSLAGERSEKFNETPTMEYLKSVELKALEIKAKSGKKVIIPDELRPADLNKDGYISAAEHAKVIDAFFNGESDLTAEQIKRLNEFFFKQ